MYTIQQQPWAAMYSRLQGEQQKVRTVADTDTFKKGEAIVIGGQSKWGKAEDSASNVPTKGLWYDTSAK